MRSFRSLSTKHFSTKSASRPQALRRAAPQVEALEDRQLLSSTLYLDFGDSFPAGGLQLTPQQLSNDFGASTPGLQGPNVRRSDDPTTTTFNEAIGDTTPLTFRALSTRVTFDYNGDGTVNASDYTTLRSAVVRLVQRYYQPFDVNVVVAPALNNTSSGNYLAGVRTQLQTGANVAGERDGWVFLADVVRTTGGSSVGSLLSDNGISAGVDIGRSNARDDSAVVFADIALQAVLTGSSPAATANTRLAYTAAHEAGHDFGLQHTNNGRGTSGNAQTDADLALLTSSNLVTMSAADVNRTNFDFVTRFDLTRGGTNNNTAPNVFNINDKVNHYEILANPNNLGLRTGEPTYITGTGAFDRITVTRAGVNLVTFKVEAFREAGFTNLLGTYTRGNLLSNGVFIDGGLNADQIIVDSDLGLRVYVNGGAGTDTLVVRGKSAPSGIYTPGTNTVGALDGNADARGVIVSGSTTISFTEFEAASQVWFQDFVSVTVVTPLSSDNLTVSSPAGNQTLVTGSSGGIAIVPALLQSVGALTLDTAQKDGTAPNDQVAFNSTAAGVTTRVNSGPGADIITIGTATSQTGGSVYVDGGAGNDSLSVLGAPIAAVVQVTGGDGDDTVVLDNAANVRSLLIVDTGAGNDTVRLNSVAAGLVNQLFTGADNDTLIIGNGTPSLASFTADTGLGNDTVTVNSIPTGTTVQVNGGDGNDTFRIEDARAVTGVLSVSGGVGTLDRLEFVDSQNLHAADTLYTISQSGVTRTGATTATAIYNSIEDVQVSGGLRSRSVFKVDSTSVGTPVTIRAGNSNDVVTVGNSNSLNQVRTVSIVGGVGTTLVVDDQNNRDVTIRPDRVGLFLGENNVRTAPRYVVNDQAVSRANRVIETDPITGAVQSDTTYASTIAYRNVASVTILGGRTQNFFDVQSTADGVRTVLTAGVRSDQVRVGGDAGLLRNIRDLTVHGNTGTTLVLDDHNDRDVRFRPDRVDLFLGENNISTEPKYFITDQAVIRTDHIVESDPVTGATLSDHSPLGTIAYRNVASLSLLGGSSNNIFQVSGSAAAPLTIDAGSGNDIVVGGASRETLRGGAGRDLLIAGAGADVLDGGDGEDILIGGLTIYDLNMTALAAIMAEWSRSDLPYANRVDHLLLGGGLNGSTRLDLAAFTSNGGGNSLTGAAGLDWYFGSRTRDTHDWRSGVGEIFADPSATPAIV